MRRAMTDFFVWYCDWCDSRNLLPNILRKDYGHFCPACGRESSNRQPLENSYPLYTF